MIKNNGEWAKSICICVIAGLIMLGSAGYLLSDNNQTMYTGSSVMAAFETRALPDQELEDQWDESPSLIEETQHKAAPDPKVAIVPENENSASSGEQKNAAVEPVEENTSIETNKSESAGHKEEAASINSSLEENSLEQVNKTTTAANAEPAVNVNVDTNAEKETAENQAAPVPEAEPATYYPATYKWGSAENYTFMVEVKVTNNGADPSRKVKVSVPLPESSSPCQVTSFKSVNYNSVSTSGRAKTFDLGDIASGETKTVNAIFNINVRPVSVNSTNETIERARKIYEQFAGSGNCRTLARGFIGEAQEIGINAREVIGFANPQREAMIPGSLQGYRHSWAEFYVDGLGWVPVDLTFQYFGEIPHASHIIEGYNEQSITVKHFGGSLSVNWENFIQ